MDSELRKLERAARLGDPTALAQYIGLCKRIHHPLEHGLAILHIRNIIRGVDQSEEITFTQLGFWVIEALAVNVVLYTDDDYRDYQAEDKTGGTDWLILPTEEQLATLQRKHRGLLGRLEWSPALLMIYWEDSNNEGLYDINDDWGAQPRFIKIDFTKTYEDVMERAENPPHMCYGNCGCRACEIRNCCTRF